MIAKTLRPYLLKASASTALAFICILPLPASAQSVEELHLRLNHMENELQTINRAFYKGQNDVQKMQGQRADIQVDLQQFEQQIRSFQGQIEELSHEIRQFDRKIDKINEENRVRYEQLDEKLKIAEQRAELAETQMRVQAAEAKARAAITQQPATLNSVLSTAQTSPAATAAPPALQIKNEAYQPDRQTDNQQGLSPALKTNPASALDAPQTGTMEALAQYEAAFSLLKQGQYNSAQLEFERFLSANPSHMLAGNAQYWLGETFYVRGDYPQAARTFAEGFQAYPKGSKAPDNLLKLGLTLEALGKTKDACIALQQIKKEFPTGASAVLSRAQTELTRLECAQ